MSLATLARSSLAQFMVIYSEVIAENGDKMTKEQLESLMWEKIIGGVKPSGVSKIPSTMLKKIKAQLPYLPDIINYMGCPALKPCGGLYVPCGGKQADDEQFCATCSKHAAKFGTLADRDAPGTYTDPNDKHEISYGTWLAKNEITIEEVYSELTSAGFTFEIPEDQLAVNAKRAEPKRRPGRPGVVKKTKVNDDGSISPIGTPLDGDGHEVILNSESSGDESEGTKVVKANVQARKEEADEEPEKKPKAKKAAKEPKEPKAEKKEKAEKAAKEPKEPKAEKKEKKPKTAPKPRAKKGQLEAEDEEEEAEENIVIDGKKYMLRGKNIHDEDGYHKGILRDGVPEWIATSP